MCATGFCPTGFLLATLSKSCFGRCFGLPLGESVHLYITDHAPLVVSDYDLK